MAKMADSDSESDIDSDSDKKETSPPILSYRERSKEKISLNPLPHFPHFLLLSQNDTRKDEK